MRYFRLSGALVPKNIGYLSEPSPTADNYLGDVRAAATFTIMHNVILITVRRSPAQNRGYVLSRGGDDIIASRRTFPRKWVRNALWLVLKRDNSHLSIVPGTTRIVHNLDETISLGQRRPPREWYIDRQRWRKSESSAAL